MTSPDIIAALEAVDAATPGRWGVEDPMDFELSIVANPDAQVYDWVFVAACPFPDEDEHTITGGGVKANAAAIVAAINLLRDPTVRARLLGDWRPDREAVSKVIFDTVCLSPGKRLEDGFTIEVNCYEIADALLRALAAQQPQEPEHAD